MGQLGESNNTAQMVLEETTGHEGWDETTCFSRVRAGNGTEMKFTGGGGTFVGSNNNSGINGDQLNQEDTAIQNGVAGGNKASLKKLTFWQAYLNLVRASIGPGCLSLPYAFSNAGKV